MTGVYERDFAQLYDLFHAGKPYESEARFVDAWLREEARGPSVRLLDIACGTGQHAVQFAALGWDVVGVDQSADMLRQARDRAGKSGAFVQQDMRHLALKVRGFDAAVCLFDSIGYAVSNAAIQSTLRAIHEHIRRDGLLILEFWHAAAMLREYETTRVREWDTADGTIMRIARTTLDVAADTARVDYEVYRLTAAGSADRWIETHVNRYFLVQEMDLFLRGSGFEPLRWSSGYDGAAPIDERSWHIVVLARAIPPDVP